MRTSGGEIMEKNFLLRGAGVSRVFGTGCGLLFVLLLCGACSFGTQGDALSDEEALLSYVLGVAGTGAMNVQLRFGDGGLDAIDSFSSNQGTVQLSSAWLDVEKIDVYAGASGIPAPILPAADALTFDGREFMAPVSRHEEDIAPAAGVSIFVTGRDRFVQPLSAGSFGNGRDSLELYYFGTDGGTLALPPGGVQSVVLHVRRMQFVGTIGGASFTALYSVASDFAVTPRCAATVSPVSSTAMLLYFDYARLFANLGGTAESDVSAAFAANIPGGTIMREHECFSF